MFKKFFSKNKKRDLFEELFPLSDAHKTVIESQIKEILQGMFGEENYEQLRNYHRNYSVQKTQFHSLTIDTLGWQLVEEEAQEDQHIYVNEYGDHMIVVKTNANGEIRKGVDDEDVYRNWLRSLYVPQNGGVLLCEHYENNKGIDAYESICKHPMRETGVGMEYAYMLNARNYEEQKLYQVLVNVKEFGTTGIRDNAIMHPLSDIAQVDLNKLMGLYRKDPYNPKFTEGNTRNLSEMEEFDYLFPFHPLSIIRREIRPKLLKSVAMS